MSQPHATPERILQMAWGYAPVLIINAAVRNRIFDVLDAGPKTLDEVAAETGADPRGARAVMNALVGLEFLAREGERYRLTPESAAFLVRGRPAYFGEFLRHIGSDLIPGWLELPEAVAHGAASRKVNQEGDGAEFFADFVEALLPLNFRAAQELAEHLLPEEPSGSFRVLDLAAGSGVWSIPLAQRSPQVEVTAVDWPGVLPATERITGRFGVGDRYRMVGGDIQTADFGAGYQAATLGHILHSEGVERSRSLLRRVHEALAPGGTAVIAEFVPNDDRTGPPQPLIFAVNMFLHTEVGDTFTFAEMKGWLEEAGFGNVRTLEVSAPSPLILADKAG